MKQKLLLLLFMSVIPIAMMAYDAKVDDIYYNLDKNAKTASVTYKSSVDYNSYSGSVVIPSSIVYKDITYSVTSIGERAFYKCTSLTSVNIPNGVTSIKNETFYLCTKLTSIDIPNSVTSIGEWAFGNCYSLASINISNSVTSIGECAFYWCGKLTSIDIPNSVTSIGASAFEECHGLTSVNIPNSVESIGAEAFRFCTELTSINIPNRLIVIDSLTFANCYSLTSITIPSSVTSIRKKAFAGCNQLTSVTMKSSNPPYLEYYYLDYYNNGIHPFSNYKNATLRVPYGSLETYQNANYWNAFKDIIEVDTREVQTLSLPQNLTMTYGDPEYQLPANTEEGLPLTWTSTNPSIASISENVLTIKKAGSLAISCKQEGNEDYFSYNNYYALTIGKAGLQITADNHAMYPGDELPELTVKYDGFKYNDDVTCLTTRPKVTTTATSSSPIGNYPIVVSGAQANNYNISYANGTLSVIDGSTLHNTLSPKTIEIMPGSSAFISVELINEDPIIMVEFYLQLPEGISVSKDEDGYWDATLNSNRSNRHNIDVEKNSDGLYHFLVYSTSNNSFKGNEGELISIKVECDNNIESGEYQATLKNILFNNADKEEIVQPNYKFNVNVTNMLWGDVNGDGKINGSDIVELVDQIMGRVSHTATADQTGDGDVNGSDLVEEISLVMSQSISQAPIVSENAPRLLTPRMTLNSNDCGKAILGVESGESFILSQMALQLSEGQHLTDITTDAHHSVEYRQLSENTYFVLCYSSKNAIFSSNEDLLTVHYTGQGKIYMKDVMMVDNNKQEWHFAPICSNDATGIDWVNRSLSQPTDIYSINGRIVRQQATSLEGLAKGVYLINGNKIIIK